MSHATSPAHVPVRVPKRIAATLINSLKGGVVPRIGLPYITVGRETEIAALLHDLDLIAESGATDRARAFCCRPSATTPWARTSS